MLEISGNKSTDWDLVGYFFGVWVKENWLIRVMSLTFEEGTRKIK